MPGGPSDTNFTTSKLNKTWDDKPPNHIEWRKFSPYDINTIKKKKMWENAIWPDQMVAVIRSRSPVAIFNKYGVQLCPQLLQGHDDFDVWVKGQGSTRATHVRYDNKWWAVFGMISINGISVPSQDPHFTNNTIYDHIIVLHPFLKKTNEDFLNEQYKLTWKRLEKAIEEETMKEIILDKHGQRMRR